MKVNDRLFSENDPTEILYSVLMSEPEYSIYSEFIESFYSNDDDDEDDEDHTIKIAKAAGIGGAAAIVGGAATVTASDLYRRIPNTPTWRNAKRGAAVAGIVGTGTALVDVYRKKKRKNKKQ